jgi:hypothetical protein
MGLSRLRNVAHSSSVAPVVLAECVLGSRARHELSSADGQGPEPQQSLVIFSEFADVVG